MRAPEGGLFREIQIRTLYRLFSAGIGVGESKRGHIHVDWHSTKVMSIMSMQIIVKKKALSPGERTLLFTRGPGWRKFGEKNEELHTNYQMTTKGSNKKIVILEL